jgi:nitrogen fixation NifU-like protein
MRVWIITAYLLVVVIYVSLVLYRCFVDESKKKKNPYLGRMNDPSAAARVTGPCGDTMEFYLVIHDDVIETVQYHTDGCQYTHLCGAAVAVMAEGGSLKNALSINPALLLDELKDLPPEHRHCAILSVSTLYRAIGEYWVQWARS